MTFVYTFCILTEKPLEFEWDSNKASLNVAKHGVSFEEATEVFLSPNFQAPDTRKDYGEKRFISVGSARKSKVLVVVFAIRNKRIRLISARKANGKEKENFKLALAKKIDE